MKKLLSVLVAICATMNLFTVMSHAETADYKELYLNYANDAETNEKNGLNYMSGVVLVDLNQDGVPELLPFSTSSERFDKTGNQLFADDENYDNPAFENETHTIGKAFSIVDGKVVEYDFENDVFLPYLPGEEETDTEDFCGIYKSNRGEYIFLAFCVYAEHPRLSTMSYDGIEFMGSQSVVYDMEHLFDDLYEEAIPVVGKSFYDSENQRLRTRIETMQILLNEYESEKANMPISEIEEHLFITDTTKFYVEENKLCAQDRATGEVTVIDSAEETEFNEVDYAIYNVYKDKYLYYGRYDNVVFYDLVIYDLEEGKEIFFYENIAGVDMIGEKIYMQSDVSDVSPCRIYEANLDGSEIKTITDDCFYIYEIIDDKLYYADYDTENGYYNPRSEVKRYDPAKGEIESLTPRLDGYARINDAEYATFSDLYGNYATDVYFTEESDKEINVELNGEKLTFDQTPIMVNERVMVPIRVIFEALGYTLEWDGETETAIATKGDEVIRTTVGDMNIKYGDEVYEADVAPINVSGRVLVPIRAISESAGCAVDWIGETKTVTITK